ncbi:SMP-30/gluconolactonase/LRE family protein [Zavarzinia sp. CC-PAN008]|uniref:SMP-30/gluconolactonase/LRE family protein n=1 Tax=Zavarzinia sp. CC-PAN008 TaxID=3243332 RepID=UPI003F74361C
MAPKIITKTDVLAGDFIFLEGPRWHGKRLWLSDMWGRAVWAVAEDGTREKMADVPGKPSGIGFGADGSALIVSMDDRTLMRLVDGRLTRVADLSSFVRAPINDLVMDISGRAYIGNFGFDYLKEEPVGTDLLLVHPDGKVEVVAGDLLFPNGMVMMNGGQQIVVAESFGRRLTAFSVDEAGHLSDRRVFADLGDGTPDGICLDTDGGIWVSLYGSDAFVRVVEGGAVTHRVETPGRRAVACQLGGADGHTLFCLTYSGPEDHSQAPVDSARIEVVRVDSPAAGSP